MLGFSRLAPLLLLVTACGGLEAPPGSLGGTGAGGAATGGFGAVGGTGGWVGTGGAGGTGGWSSTGGVPGCFAPPTPNLVSVVVTNYTGQTIYLGQTTANCELEPLFRVFREGSGEIVQPKKCEHICGQGPGCNLDCPYPSALSLGPNESAKLLYDATDYVSSYFEPGTCEDSGECLLAKTLEPGNYTFMAAAGMYADCSETTSTCAPCDPAESGGCTIPAALVPLYSFAAQAAVWLDPASGTSETVVLDFYPTKAPD